MADVSSRLRAARERAGLRLEDVSARTKIKLVQLQAIERGEFERLPGEFFTRAFLRNFAREVGLSPDEIVREYDESRVAPERGAEGTRPAGASQKLRTSGGFSTAVSNVDEDERAPAGRLFSLPSPRSAWPVLALALVLLMIISVLNRQPEGSGEAGAVRATGAEEPAAAPAATSGQAEPQSAPERLSMDIRASELIWINAKADGQTAIYRLVQPGERLKIEAERTLTFRIGNAAAFEYSINGVPGRALGGPGEVREFEITRENFRSYQQQ